MNTNTRLLVAVAALAILAGAALTSWSQGAPKPPPDSRGLLERVAELEARLSATERQLTKHVVIDFYVANDGNQVAGDVVGTPGKVASKSWTFETPVKAAWVVPLDAWEIESKVIGYMYADLDPAKPNDVRVDYTLSGDSKRHRIRLHVIR